MEGIVKKRSTFSSKALYGNFSIALLAFMVVTLLPHYGEIADPDTEVSPQLIAHGILYLSWYILFCVQSRLSAVKNIALHRKLGFLSLLLVALLLYSGVEMLYGVMLSGERASFVWGIFHTIASFSLFYVLGVVFR